MQPAPLFRTLFLALLFGLPACASADNATPAEPAPRGNQPQQADLSALEKPDSGYRFVTRRLLSEDGKRRYRVYIGIPKQPAPAGGFPVLYALDGNAAAAYLDDAAFARLRQNPVILVLIAPDSSLRIDRAQRAWDYTPPVSDQTCLHDPIDPALCNGGALGFFRLLTGKIRPLVTEAAPMQDARRQTLWGHSYGGLFVLYTFLYAPQSFNRYVAADPSLWLRGGSGLPDTDGLDARLGHGTRNIWLHKSGGTLPGALQGKMPPPDPERLQRFAEQLDALPNVSAVYEEYPAETHGSLMKISFQAALTLAAEP
ncbi:alpha/beta hydrolase [Eikenella corrodens]|uniref:alpha/beta hydrolase n=1 Tax=Eikenella corrodens TaxID=539 RepID=UPI00241F46B1|nr:alpha/beta hydrolase-fold protein [Eikenella corrodens]